MATFGISMDGVPVRYTDDLPSGRQIRIRYALTFDEKHSNGTENPIAKFVVENGRIREVQSGFYIKHTWWDSFYAVLVPSDFSNTQCCWEFVPASSGKYFIRRIITGLGWTHYLGSGNVFEPAADGNCPPTGLVMFARVDQNVPIQGFCMQREWTIRADDSSQQDQIINSLAPITSCAIDEDCEEYGTFGRVCRDGVCVDPDPIDCEWKWLEWGPCDPVSAVRHRNWEMVQPAKYGGSCDAPVPGFSDEQSCRPGGGDGEDVGPVVPSDDRVGTDVPAPISSSEIPTIWIWNPFETGFFQIGNASLWIYLAILLFIAMGLIFQRRTPIASDK